MRYERRLKSVLSKIQPGRIVENLDARMAHLAKPVTAMLQNPNPNVRRFLKSILDHEPTADDIPTIINRLARFDPTGPKYGTYVAWIIRILRKGAVRLPEDGNRILSALEFFDKIKKTQRYKGPRDINQLGLAELEKIKRELNVPGNEHADLSIEQWYQLMIKKASKIIFEDSKYSIRGFWNSDDKLSVTSVNAGRDWFPTWSVSEEKIAAVEGKTNQWGEPLYQETKVSPAAVALSHFAHMTEWCVLNMKIGQEYLNDGPIYMISRNGEKYMLVTDTFSQMKDLRDIEISRASPALCHLFKKLIAGNYLGTIAKKNAEALIRISTPPPPKTENPPDLG